MLVLKEYTVLLKLHFHKVICPQCPAHRLGMTFLTAHKHCLYILPIGILSLSELYACIIILKRVDVQVTNLTHHLVFIITYDSIPE